MNFRSCSSDTTSYQETEERRKEREALKQEKKAMTRREKKAKYGWSSYHAKAEKFDINQEDSLIYRRRKSHKNNTTKSKHKRDMKYFYKFEGIFKRWLKENIDRFNYKPIPKEGGGYHLEGIIKNIEFGVSDYEVYLSFLYFGEPDYYGDDNCFDFCYMAYIGKEKYHPQKGFYDGDRPDGIYTYFPTREALYINEVFEYAISYCNEMLVPENSLYLNSSCGITSAMIYASDESDKKNKRVYSEEDDYIKELSQEECLKLYKDDKAYKYIKYDLFDRAKEPLIKYRRK
ncbi:MAG: hypothetical protein Q9M43_04505 [Sulfurimonas sp.]|nr:hypothetical protein [Sulfurimonas sp.]